MIARIKEIFLPPFIDKSQNRDSVVALKFNPQTVFANYSLLPFYYFITRVRIQFIFVTAAGLEPATSTV